MSTTEQTTAPIAGQPKQSALMQFEQRGVALGTLEQVLVFSKAVIEGGWAPKDFKTPQAVMVAIQYGAELGLSPMTSLTSIAVINGRPAVFGDALKAIVDGSGLMEDYKDEVQPSYAKVSVLRRGHRDYVVRTFSIDDAKKANLWGKAGPWSQYPQRMLLMRARSWALRDAFSDCLKGCIAVEEARDIPTEPRNVTPATQSLSQLDAPKQPDELATVESPAAEPEETPLFDQQTLDDIAASKARA